MNGKTIIFKALSAAIFVAALSGCLSPTIRSSDEPNSSDAMAPTNGVLTSRSAHLRGGQTFTITWNKFVDNVAMSAHPIDLQYFSAGSWHPIATGIADSGSYVWTVPSIDDNNVRLELDAWDTSGNVAQDQTALSSFTIDSTRPSVVLTSSDSTPIIGPVTINATFSEAVSGVTLSDFGLTNLTAGTFTAVSSTVYTLVVTPIAAGAVNIAMAANAAQDLVGNQSLAASTLNMTYDPSCTMAFHTTGATFQASDTRTGASNLVWTINGTNYNNVNSVNVNFGSAAIRAHTFKIDNGQELTVMHFSVVTTNTVSDVTFTKGCAPLQTLYIEYNPITTLDVSMLTGLQNLYAGDIFGGDSTINKGRLTTIDVSKNLALKNLYLDYNSLTSLDLHLNTQLQTLHVNYNSGLTNININGLTALTNLFAQMDALTSLDVTTNTALTFINASYNQITSIDLTHNTALTSVDLTSNLLTSLDITHNTALTNLQLGNMFSGDSSVNTNRITSLDLSHNTALQTLNVDYNSLSSLDAHFNTQLLNLQASIMSTLNSINLTGLNLLQTLRLRNDALTSLNITTNTSLTLLDADFNQIPNIDLTNNTAMATLYLAGNLLTTLDVTHLPNLSYLYIGDTFAGGLAVNTNRITSLNLHNNPVLNTIYADYNSFTSLDFSDNPLLVNVYASYISSLTSLILTNAGHPGTPALQSLTVMFDSIGPTVDLSQSTSLNLLYIQGNQLTGALNTSSNTLLQNLSLGSAGFGAGANTNRVSSLNLTNNVALTALTIDFNSMTSLNLSANVNLQTFSANYLPAGFTSINFTGLTKLADVIMTNDPGLATVTTASHPLLWRLFVDADPVASIDLSGAVNILVFTANGCTNLSSLNLTGLTKPSAYIQFRSVGSANMHSIFNQAYTARASIAAGITLDMASNGTPTAPDLTEIGVVTTNPYNWTVLHN